MPVSSDPKVIERFLTRSVENAYPNREAVAKALSSKKPLTIYAGIDPTGPTLHLGHVIWLRKLAELQQMGHAVIMLIGDFTAMIGDPTDKGAARKRLTRKEVLANCKLYKKQASRFLKFTGANAAQLKFNSKWLAKMSFTDVVELAAHFTVQQMAERDMFENRMKEGKPVYLHEFLYPLMQGYDSVALNVDMEIGGNDQTFNMLAGRTLMREMKQKEKCVISTKLLVDTTGKKMGKSEGNMIALTDTPEDMFGKVMSWSDEMIVPGFELLTDTPMLDIQEMRTHISNGENPMPYKQQLAKTIVANLLGRDAAFIGEGHFMRVHQSHEVPENIPQLKVTSGMTITDVLVESGIVSSKSEARRQIDQNAVKINSVIITDPLTTVRVGNIVQKGKRHFVKLI